MRTKLLFIGIVILTLILYLPSFNVFFTNDDFFLLKISQASNISEFINFFNFTKGPDGLGMYRPLTIQVFYFLAHVLFNLNPFPMHIIVYIVFILLLFSIYIFSKKLFEYLKVKNPDSPSLLVVFLYAVSATHFGHMYYLATFQEVAMTLFSVLSIYFYLQYLDKKNRLNLLWSLLVFVLALLSKENAVVIPGLIFVTHLFRQIVLKERLTLINVVKLIFPFVVILSIYLYFHFFVYGLATGDSYIWDFSVRKGVNTLAWYLLWSFNIPEMFVDYIGPGFNVNPNLAKYWLKETIILLSLIGCIIIYIAGLSLYYLRKDMKTLRLIMLFSICWFIIALLPVIFLPIHKFTYYLTMPILGLMFLVVSLVQNTPPILRYLFLSLFVCTVVVTLNLTMKTHWIYRGQLVAEEVNKYIMKNYEKLENKTIYFVDTPRDLELPWSPTDSIKVILSDQNFRQVFYPKISYFSYISNNVFPPNEIVIHSRQFLGY